MANREPKESLLLVEGNDDFHVMCALMQLHRIPETFDIKDCKGISPLLQSVPAHVQLRKRLGIVVDADVDLEVRWKQVMEVLTDAGYDNLPDLPAPNGTIIVNEGKPVVGVWLMPNNQLPGKLENFVSFLVPLQNKLWDIAVSAVGQVPDCSEKFLAKDTDKALVHTWLAWQRDPGIPMGLAITRKFLDGDVPEVHQFLEWIRILFTE